ALASAPARGVRSIPDWLRHPASLAAAGFLAIRGLGLLALAWSPERAGRPLIEVLGIWDGGWYVRIAEEGYADHLDLSAPATDQSTSSLAFLPLYPMLLRFVSAVTGLDTRWAGALVSLTAGAVAAAGVAILATEWAGRRVGVLAGLLWATGPMAVVGTLVYTEALFTALAVWTFLALRRHWWLGAGVLGAAAGLTRPTGIAVGVAVVAYGAWTVVQPSVPDRSVEPDGTERVRPAAMPRRTTALVLIAGVLALAGTPAFWLWVGLRSGRWDGWFAVQNAFWGSRFDGGASMLDLSRKVVLGESVPGVELMSLAVVGCLLGAVLLLALAARDRVWWPLLIYAAMSLVMVIGSAGYFSSKLRFLVPIFVLVFPLARWLGNRSRPAQIIVVLAAVAATTVSGAWLLLSWPYAI
ncbi:MAG: glycosyltransferase family 39 protein, partial [Actinomycetota bacterium]|nr:glycosyltransferase family 39 protein [Actinomycetota bacterium]